MLALLRFFFLKESKKPNSYKPVVCFFLNFPAFFLLQKTNLGKREDKKYLPTIQYFTFYKVTPINYSET